MHDGTLGHFDWPVKSPDLNSIDILCDYLEQQVKQQNRLCELYLNCSQSVEKWNKIDKKYIRVLVTSLLDSIIAVIKATGGVTKLFGKNFFVLGSSTYHIWDRLWAFSVVYFKLSEVWNDAFGDPDHLQTYLSVADGRSWLMHCKLN